MMHSMAPFKLSKWYLDCCTDSGDTSIAYTGTLLWGMVRLHYSSLLESTGSRVVERHSLRQQRDPENSDGAVVWRSEALGIEGAWQADSAALRETIYSSNDDSNDDSKHGSIEWHCLMPRAAARLGVRSGFGYVEHLTMTIPPWKLPIHTLRWGRFTSVSDWMVWIDWVGDFSKRIVCLNGQMLACVNLEDGLIETNDGVRLTLDRSLLLRDGALGSTALSVIPGVNRLFPARLLQVDECKWRSRARLEQTAKPAADGWAIHEIVRWPQ
jgi:hypothetical protein